MGERVAIIGMNNPLSINPRYALWPDPPRCTGWRLWQITAARTGATQWDYIRTFQRYNLTVGGWSGSEGLRNWENIQGALLEDFDVVLLLGAAVRQAAGMGALPELCIRGGVATLPHPSGLNRWYNKPTNMRAAEILMEELYLRSIAE